MTVRAYTARAMTGESWESLIAKASYDRASLAMLRVEALDPVLAEVEGMSLVPHGVIGRDGWTNPEELREHWNRDKKMIRRAHVLIDFSPESKSEGVAHEIGYARYHLWMPIVRVYPSWDLVPKYSIALFEDDIVVGSVVAAALEINKRWGTWQKRFVWRLKLYNRCWLRAMWHKLGRWF